MFSTIAPTTTRTATAAAKPPRLALRFAVYTGVALLVIAVAMLWILERDVETRAEQRAVTQTQQIAEATLREDLAGSDFTGPVTAARRRALDRVFREVALSGFMRATLFGRDGVVTYSTERASIGARQPSAALGTALKRSATPR